MYSKESDARTKDAKECGGERTTAERGKKGVEGEAQGNEEAAPLAFDRGSRLRQGHRRRYEIRAWNGSNGRN